MKPNILNIENHVDRILTMIIEFAPHLIGAFLLLFIGLWLIKKLAQLSSIAMDKKDLDVSLKTFLLSLISIGLKVVLIVTVAGMLGIGTTSFVTILGAAGLAVGLALQGSLSNFAGGVLILIFKPFKVGDVIEAQGQTGRVIEIEIFNTILLTPDLKTVILPNGAVSNGTIVNNTQHGNLRVSVEIIVSAENDIDKVKDLLLKAIAPIPLINQSPNTSIVATKIMDNAVTLVLRAYCDAEVTGNVTSEMIELCKKTIELNFIKVPIKK